MDTSYSFPNMVDPVEAAEKFVKEQERLRLAEVDYDKQTVQKIVSIFDNAYTVWQPYFHEVGKNLRYIIGEQLSKEVREQLREDNRPEFIFNILQSLIVYVAGVIAKNRFRMRANPIRKGDEKGAEFHTVLNEWAMNGCDGDYEISRASVFASIAKIGWTNNYWDTVKNKWVTKCISSFKIMFDTDSNSKEDQEDWKWLIYHDYYTAEQIINIYGLEGEVADGVKSEAEKLEAPFKGVSKPKGQLDRVISGVLNFFGVEEGKKEAHEGVDNYGDLKNGLYRVVEFHDKRYYTKRRLYNPMTREILEIPLQVMQDQIKLKEIMDAHVGWMSKDEQIVELWVTSVCPRLLTDKVLLEKPYVVQDCGFQLKPIFWHSFHPDPTKTRSILDDLIHVQDYFNQKMLSEMLWIMQAVNPDYIVEKLSIDSEDKDGWKSKKRGKLKYWNSNTGRSAPKREEPSSSAENAIIGAQNKALELKSTISGISPNQLGFSDTAKESGVLFNQRIQAGLTMLETAFEHIKRSQEHIFTYCDRNLQQFMTMPRAVRLLGEPPEGLDGVDQYDEKNQSYWLNLNMKTLDGVLNDVTQGQYDFKPDPTQLGSTAKQAKFLEMKDLISILAPEERSAVVPIWLADYDHPKSREIASRLEKIWQMKMGVQMQNAALNVMSKQTGIAGQQLGIEQQEFAPQLPEGTPNPVNEAKAEVGNDPNAATNAA